MVGVELETEITDSPIDVTDGLFKGHRFFTCQGGKGLFVHAHACLKDRRFGDTDLPSDGTVLDKARTQFGNVDCPIVKGTYAPLSKTL